MEGRTVDVDGQPAVRHGEGKSSGGKKRSFESVQVVSGGHQRVVAKGLAILPDDRCPERDSRK
jgi:uncharacterized Zn-binding protein involved in type VI secretion